MNTNNARITGTNVTQTANEVLGTKEKTLYYLIVEVEGKEKLVINVGEKTHNAVLELTKPKDVTTKIEGIGGKTK